MGRIRQNFFILLSAILIAVGVVKCNNFDEFKKNLFSIKNFDIANGINWILSGNWTQDQQCLTELAAIQNGLKNSKEWAFKIADAWGKFPPGIYRYNFFDPGSFSECLHIERDGEKYKTQYCIGQLIYETAEQRKAKQMQKKVNDLPFRQRLGFYNTGPSISVGICLPSSCKIEQLESNINRIIHQKMQNMTVRVDKDYCQTEEYPSEFNAKDYVALALLTTILILMTASTAYDVFCEAFNYKKSQTLLMFSIYTNGKKIFSCESIQSPNVIQCLHGIRAIVTLWVVAGHTYVISMMLPTRELAEFIEYNRTYRSAFIFIMIITDTFFTISGLLQSIKLLKILKRNGRMNIWSMYLHRYLRLTPMLVGVIFLTMTLVRFMGSGPFWPFMIDHFTGSCTRYWWSTLLYVQNYVNPHAVCFAQAWYLSPDMHLFVLSPFVVYFLHRYRMKAILTFLAVILGSFVFTVAIHLIYNFTDFFVPGKYHLDHVPTHARLTSWLVGIITGYMFVEIPQESTRIPKALNLCAWLLSFASLAYAIFGFHPFYQIGSIRTTALHFGLSTAFSHLMWPIPLCYIIFACAFNSGGAINRFLSHPNWQIISKISYAMYLVHHPIILLTAASIKTLPYFSEITMAQTIIGNIGLTIVVAIPVTLAFDSPIDTIDRLILGASTPKQASIKTNKEGKEK